MNNLTTARSWTWTGTRFHRSDNLSDEYINAVELHGHWKDTGVRVTGEAAWNFTAMFLEFWHAYRPESVNEPLDAFAHAHHPAPFAGEDRCSRSAIRLWTARPWRRRCVFWRDPGLCVYFCALPPPSTT